MKIKYLLLCLIFLLSSVPQLSAQAPDFFKYQAAIRKADGNPLRNANVGVQVTIKQYTAAGNNVFRETHRPRTSDLGLIHLRIGGGTPVISTLSAIDWADGPYFIMLAIDRTGGTSYIELSTTQLLSVPYALYADVAGNAGNVGANGTNYSDYLYWNDASSSWEVGSSEVHLGENAGATNQGTRAVAIGSWAGATSQGFDAIAVGARAGETNQDDLAIAVGNRAGKTDQRFLAIAVGNEAGKTDQGFLAIAVGNRAGETNQGTGAVAVGNQAGKTDQDLRAISVGERAGETNQGSLAIAVGPLAGATTQGSRAIAVGPLAGYSAQGSEAIALGKSAGFADQGDMAIAVGESSGETNQGSAAVAVGRLSGETDQGSAAVAIGSWAGATTQGSGAIAIGSWAGATTQGSGAIAVGPRAGQTTQGSDAIAIGRRAGETNQHAASIVLNASGAALNTAGTNRFYVKPIRNQSASTILFYDAITGEVTYGASSSSVFGANNHYVSSEGESTTISTVLQRKVTLWTSSLTAGTYKLGYTFEVSNASNGVLTEVEVKLDGVVVARPTIEADNDYSLFSGFIHQSLSGVVNAEISYRVQTAGTAKIRRARLELWRVQ